VRPLKVNGTGIVSWEGAAGKEAYNIDKLPVLSTL
jgi:hypothetical protein